jgi:M6 family metalloprotease-like protein
MQRLTCALVVLLVLGTPLTSSATVPPQRGGRLPEELRAKLQREAEASESKRGFTRLTTQIRTNRLEILSGKMSPAAAAKSGGTVFNGTKQIRVLPLMFQDSGKSDPYAVTLLQQVLFDGPSPTETMTDYFREVSYGNFLVSGMVSGWRRVKNDSVYYSAGCKGLCEGAPLAEMVKERLDAESGLDWAAYDNDGSDDKPNSGDDDGFVDFVVFVHPDRGGECNGSGTIWSQHNSLGADAYITSTKRPDGTFIKIDGYVVSAGRACDAKSINTIGVLSHELGHALDLPDLYDTDGSNGQSYGVGVWCLMGMGGWGGDWNTPSRPMHLGAWAKARLGWVTPDLIVADRKPGRFLTSAKSPAAYKLRVNAHQYYLIENRQRVGFDSTAPGVGLLVWKINEAVINAQERDNLVNADETNKGVEVVQADGFENLNFAEVACSATAGIGCGTAGDDSDTFRGAKNILAFDTTTSPAAAGSIALCNIGLSQSIMESNVLLAGPCSVAKGPTPVPAPPAKAARQQPQSPQAQPQLDPYLPLVSITSLLESPAEWAGRRVRVQGQLENAGTSFFRNRRLQLVDENERAIAVRSVDLPAEAAPKASGTAGPTPITLASYMGKNLDAIAMVETAVDGKTVTIRLQSVRLRQ